MQVGRTIGRLRRRDAEAHELGIDDGVLSAEHERQRAVAHLRPNDLPEAGLVDRDLTPPQGVDFSWTMSAQITLCPRWAKHAPVARPT